MRETKSTTSARFRQELSEFEAAVTGSGAGLVEVVSRECDDFDSAFRDDLESHRATYQMILERAPELAVRVDQMRTRDGQIREEFDRLMVRVAEAKDDPPDSRATEALRSALQTWTRRCREHEDEVLTWFMEAVYRDHGAGD